MSKVAIIEAKPSNNNYTSLFPEIEIVRYSLASDPSLKKVLKSNVDIDITLSTYDWVILIGSEALKYYTSNTSITEYSGKLVDDKFLPIINPAMLRFKPEAQKLWDDSRQSAVDYITGKKQPAIIDADNFVGINDTEVAKQYILAAIECPTPYVAIDTETTGLYPRNGYVLGISISYKRDSGAYINTDCLDEECEELLQTLFNEKRVIFHNAKFDLAMLQYHFNFKFPVFDDTMVQHYILNELPGTHGLKQLALKYTKYGDYEKDLYDWMDEFRKEKGVLKADFKWEWIPFDVMKTYAAIDATVTFILYEFFNDIISKNTKFQSVYNDLLIKGTKFLTKIQDNGVPFSKDRLLLVQNQLTQEISRAVEELRSFEEVTRFEKYLEKPFNPNSVLQLRKLLFDFLGLAPSGIKTPKGENSTNAEALEIIAKMHPVPKLILEIRKKSKIKNTYIDKIIPQLDKDGRLRTNFNLVFTTSGRLSSSGKLNMQQLPRDHPGVKGCIKARPGYKIVSIDLVTAEVYIAAVLSGDTELQQVFKDGGDFHSAIALKVFNLPCDVKDVKDRYPKERQAAKAISFGILYGASAGKIAAQVNKDGGRMTVRQAAEVIEDYFIAFPSLAKWIDKTQNFIRANAFIYSIFGRKRRLPNVRSDNQGVANHEVRSGLNFLVQSPASDVNLLAAIDAQDIIEKEQVEALIFALVHDSILAEVKDEQIEEYVNIVGLCIQADRGVSIVGCPIGFDVEVGQDYSMGKFEILYDPANNY